MLFPVDMRDGCVQVKRLRANKTLDAATCQCAWVSIQKRQPPDYPVVLNPHLIQTAVRLPEAHLCHLNSLLYEYLACAPSLLRKLSYKVHTPLSARFAGCLSSPTFVSRTNSGAGCPGAQGASRLLVLKAIALHFGLKLAHVHTLPQNTQILDRIKIRLVRPRNLSTSIHRSRRAISTIISIKIRVILRPLSPFLVSNSRSKMAILRSKS
jgi:hypothetical protein